MDIVVRETDRLNTIITEFLEYARPKAKQNEQILLSASPVGDVYVIKEQQGFPVAG